MEFKYDISKMVASWELSQMKYQIHDLEEDEDDNEMTPFISFERSMTECLMLCFGHEDGFECIQDEGDFSNKNFENFDSWNDPSIEKKYEQGITLNCSFQYSKEQKTVNVEFFLMRFNPSKNEFDMRAYNDLMIRIQQFFFVNKVFAGCPLVYFK